jgi:hypothetical protein
VIGAATVRVPPGIDGATLQTVLRAVSAAMITVTAAYGARWRKSWWTSAAAPSLAALVPRSCGTIRSRERFTSPVF